MTINYFRLTATSLLAVLLGASAQAQTGIGTTSPRTMLDVNGAIAVAEGLAAVSSNAATIPTGFSLVRLTGTATGPIALTAAASPAVVAGQLLTINNPTAYAATFNGQVISAGQSLSLVYSNSGWQGTAGGGNTPLTASNGLTLTGNNFTLGGTLSGATNVAQGGNAFSLTGGNVGIGTTTPATRLQVMVDNTASTNIIDAQALNQTVGAALWYNGLRATGSNANNSLNLDSKGTGNLNLQANGGTGSVGIGTNSPGAMLDVSGNSATTTVGTQSLLRLTRPAVGSVKYGNGMELSLGTYGTSMDSQSQLDIKLANGGTNYMDMTAMSLLGNGYVGIGTTTPTQTLDVNGSIHLSNTLMMDNSKAIFAANAAGTQEAFLWPRYADNITYMNYGSGGLSIRNNGSTPAMFMTNSGNVGIGTTTPATRLQVMVDNTASTNIIDAQALNQTVGAALWYNGLRATGSNVNNSLNLDSKGTGGLVMQGNGGTGDVTVSTNLQVNGSLNGGLTNTGSLYVSTNRPATSWGAHLQWNRSGGLGETWLINTMDVNAGPGGIYFGQSTPTNVVTTLGNFDRSGNLYVTGNIRCVALTQTSDARLKQDVQPVSSALASVLQLRGVRYTFRVNEFKAKKLPTGPQIGFLAQEVEKIFPELVSTDTDGYKAMNYAQMTPVLLEAIKEQQVQIEALKAANTKLTSANTDLKAELSGKASASTVNELQAALQSLRAEMQAQSANHTTARAK